MAPFVPAGPCGPVAPVSPFIPCGPVAPFVPAGPCGPTMVPTSCQLLSVPQDHKCPVSSANQLFPTVSPVNGKFVDVATVPKSIIPVPVAPVSPLAPVAPVSPFSP